MIERDVRCQIETSLATEAAVVLVGPRQVGKTTLALSIGEQHNALYLYLENPEDRAQLADPNRYFAINENRLIILDEIHRAPELSPVLRGVIDRERREGKGIGRFLILGSASIDLMRQSGESLAGRVAYIDMTPITVREIPHIDQSLEQLWTRGGFPESFLATSDRNSFTYRTNLVRTYLERDIPLFGPRMPAETIRRFWTMLAHRQGAPLNASDLARALETSANSVVRYIDLLSDLFLVRRLMPYSANVGKRLEGTQGICSGQWPPSQLVECRNHK